VTRSEVAARAVDRRARAGFLAAAAALTAVSACGSCGSREEGDPVANGVGKTIAAGLAGAIERSAALAEPFRCAELSGSASVSGPGADLGRRAGRALSFDGDWLRMGPAEVGRDHTLVAGVVADARGASAATLTQLGRVRAAFERERVELVVSLGGMGTSEEELTQVLGALARDAPWVVWAIPGEREAIGAHRAAVASLSAAGYPVFDATRVRMVEVDGAVLASFPGAAAASRLLAGADGCVHRPDDASALAMRLGAQKGVRVWAGHAAPRQRDDDAGDVALGGVHVGERALAAALPAARAHLVLHGMVDEAALGSASGHARMGTGNRATVLGSGPAEAMPITGPDGAVFAGAALVVRANAGAGEITWRRVRFPLGGSVSAR
jgi:hypothetical protein